MRSAILFHERKSWACEETPPGTSSALLWIRKRTKRQTEVKNGAWASEFHATRIEPIGDYHRSDPKRARWWGWGKAQFHKSSYNVVAVAPILVVVYCREDTQQPRHSDRRGWRWKRSTSCGTCVPLGALQVHHNSREMKVRIARIEQSLVSMKSIFNS